MIPQEILKLIFNWPNYLTIILGITVTIAAYAVAAKRKSPQLRSHVPSVWTSLGIFFTFVCICLGLFSTTTDKIDINVVIQKIVPAFTTSIIGIGFALFFSTINKFHRAKSDAQDSRNLETFVSSPSPLNSDDDDTDIVLLKLIKGIGDSINVTNTKLEKFTQQNEADKNEVISKVSDTFKEQNKNFTNALDSLSGKFSTAVDSASKEHKKQVDGMLIDFKTESEKQYKQHQETINNTLGIIQFLCNTINEQYAQFVNESKTRETSIKQFICNVSQSSKDYVDSRNSQLNDILESTKNSLEKLLSDTRDFFNNEIQNTISIFADEHRNKCSEIITAQQTKLISSSEASLTALTRTLTEMSEKVKASVDNLNKSVGKTLVSLFEKGTENTTKMLEENIKQYNAVTSDVTGICNKVSEDLGKAYDGFQKLLKQNFTDLATKTGEIGEKITMDVKLAYGLFETTFTQLCEDSRKFIIDSANNHKGEIATFIDSYENNLNNIAGTINENNHKIQSDLSALYNKIKESTENSSAEFLKTVRQFHAEMGKIDNAIQTASKEYLSKHNELKELVSNSSTSMVKSMAKEIRDSMQINEIKTSCSSLAEKVNDTISRFEEYAKTTEKSLSGIVQSLQSYSNIANDTEQLTKYINSTIEAYREQSNEITMVKEVMDNAINEMKNVASILKTKSDSVTTVAE